MPGIESLVADGADLVDIANHYGLDPVTALRRAKAEAPNSVADMLANRKPGWRAPIDDLLEDVRDTCAALVESGRDIDDATAIFKVNPQTLRHWLVENDMEPLYVGLMRNRPRTLGGVGRPRVYV